MSNGDIIYVSLPNDASGEECEVIRDKIKKLAPDKEVVVSYDNVDVVELPAIDDYIEEISQRTAEEIRKYDTQRSR